MGGEREKTWQNVCHLASAKYVLEIKIVFENLYTIITRVAYAVPNDEISFWVQ